MTMVPALRWMRIARRREWAVVTLVVMIRDYHCNVIVVSRECIVSYELSFIVSLLLPPASEAGVPRGSY
jgi:hypothetical protein